MEKHIKIFESDLNFKNSSSYDVVEKFVKPFVVILRNSKQKYGTNEFYVKGNLPQYVIEMVEKLSKVKIICM